MIERTPLLNFTTHAILIVGLVMLLLPLWIVFVASTHDFKTVNTVPMPLWPGSHMVENYVAAWTQSGFGPKMLNSLVMAIGVTTGKIAIAALSAYSIVYFRYRLRMVFFWLVFITLMLPLEVRIVPTYAVAANAFRPLQALLDVFGMSWLLESVTGLRLVLPEWSLLNSYSGLILPLIATATGTFLYRQFFLTVPDELLEAAKMDGTGPLTLSFRHFASAFQDKHGCAGDYHVCLFLEPISLAAAYRYRSRLWHGCHAASAYRTWPTVW